MEIPITLRFFEKLNRYQDIKRLDQRNKPEWANQRRILLWAGDVERHRHRHVELTVEMAFEHDDITGLEGKYPSAEQADEKRGYIEHSCFGNLVSAGLAKWKREDDWRAGVVFTSEGFLLGEVINEIHFAPQKRGVYEFFYWMCWVIFGAGVVIILGEAAKMLFGLWEFVAAQIGCACK